MNDVDILRVTLNEGTANLYRTGDVMIDQIRSIDNRRLIKRIGISPPELIQTVKENLQIILTLTEDNKLIKFYPYIV